MVNIKLDQKTYESLPADVQTAIDASMPHQAIDIMVKRGIYIPDQFLTWANAVIQQSMPAGQTVTVERYLNRVRVRVKGK